MKAPIAGDQKKAMERNEGVYEILGIMATGEEWRFDPAERCAEPDRPQIVSFGR